jgi:hypothetical protein
VFGSSNPYSQPGETQVSLSMRHLRSTDHYSGEIEQVQRQTLQTYVVNTQDAADLAVTRTITERFSMSLGVPYIAAAWGIPSPTTQPSPGPRAMEDGHGLGDISLSGRYWLLPTSRFRSGNIAAGIGVKFPTGNSAYRDTYPNSAGLDNRLRFVDQSVQPGDGGWGLMMELQGFKKVPHAQLFGSAAYLANPRDRNDTTSGSVNRSTSANPSTAADTAFNSVPDSFLARLGAAFPIRRTGFAGSVAWRIEGLPRYDLLGDSHGFRRPGVEMFIEPGISYARGRQFYSLNVPFGYYRNRFPNPYTGASGDATFPKHIFLLSYGYRFGAKGRPTTDTAICQ